MSRSDGLKRWGFLLALSLLAPGGVFGQSWTQRAPMPTPRWGAAAAILHGEIYVVGGQDTAGNILKTVERYDPLADTWTTSDDLDDASFGAAAAVFQGQIFVMGGRDEDGDVKDDVQVYDPVTGEWDEMEGMEEKREGHAAVVLGGVLYALGGSDEDENLLGDVEAYDAATDSWESVDDWLLDQPRAALAVATVDGAAYVLGGFSAFGPWGPVQRFSPGEGATLRATLDPPRGGLAAAAVGARIYALGGRDAADRVTRTVNVYDPAADAWAEAAALNTEREGAAAVSLDGTLYVFGGLDGFGRVRNEVEALTVGLAAPVPRTPSDGADTVALPVTLTWDAVPGAASYHLQIAENDAFSPVIAEATGLAFTRFEPTGLLGDRAYLWRVRAVDGAGVGGDWSVTFGFETAPPITGVEAVPPDAGFALAVPYPHPLATTTQLGFQVTDTAPLDLAVFDVHGRRVATLAEGSYTPGPHTLTWDAAGLAAGVYVAVLRQGSRRATRLLVVRR